MNTDILGIPVSDISLYESVGRTRRFLETDKLNTVGYVSAHKLVLASENEKQKQGWMKLDLVIFEDIEVLKASGKINAGRIKEVEEMKYLKDVLKIIAKEAYPVYLLADTQADLKELEEELMRMTAEKLYITGGNDIISYRDNKEGLINLINFQAPAVILSRIPYPEGLYLLHDYGSYINARLWIMLPDRVTVDKKISWLDKFNKFIYKNLLKKKINHS